MKSGKRKEMEAKKKEEKNNGKPKEYKNTNFLI